MEPSGKTERGLLSSSSTMYKESKGGLEPLRGSSLIASVGTYIKMKDDEEMNTVFKSLLCTILSPGKENPPETESLVKSI